MTIVVIFGVVLAGASQLLTVPLSKLFVGDYQGLYEMTVRGMRLFAISFLVQGINIFGSAFFTALNDGLVSAVLSFGRTLVFQVSAVFLLPLLLGLDGIWLAVVAAELLALVVAVVFFAAKRKNTVMPETRRGVELRQNSFRFALRISALNVILKT